jgi:hypothetical protein
MTARAANGARGRGGRGGRPVKSFGDGVICRVLPAGLLKRTYRFDEPEDDAKPAGRAWQSTRGAVRAPESASALRLALFPGTCDSAAVVKIERAEAGYLGASSSFSTGARSSPRPWLGSWSRASSGVAQPGMLYSVSL